MPEMKSVVNFKEVPLTELSEESFRILSSLNIELILSDGNLHRDWRGLSSLFKCTKFDKAAVQHHENKTRKLIEISTSINRDLKFNDLLENLQRIGRFDVYDDVIETMACDAHRYVSQPSAPSEDTDEDPFPRSQFGSFSSLSVPSCPVETSSYQVPVIPPLPEDHFITKDDKKFGKAQHYHAFVLYDENDVVHIQNVLDIVGKLEKMRFNLCIKERDFLMGIGMEHSAVMDMIEQRCYRVIIFVTRGIFSSSYNNFIMQFCQRQAIDQRRRKIIPILMEDVHLPSSLKFCSTFNFYKPSPFKDLYKTLEASLTIV